MIIERCLRRRGFMLNIQRSKFEQCELMWRDSTQSSFYKKMELRVKTKGKRIQKITSRLFFLNVFFIQFFFRCFFYTHSSASAALTISIYAINTNTYSSFEPPIHRLSLSLLLTTTLLPFLIFFYLVSSQILCLTYRSRVDRFIFTLN